MPMRLCSTPSEMSCKIRLMNSTGAETKSILMPEIQLETERLLLRMWREDDFGAYAEICADPGRDALSWRQDFQPHGSLAAYGRARWALATAWLWPLGCRRESDRRIYRADRLSQP